MQVQLRKYKDNLVNSGKVIVLFQLWAIAKIFLSIFFGFGEAAGEETELVVDGMTVVETTEPVETVAASPTFLIILVIFILGVVLLDMIFRIYIGRTAVAVGKGQKEGKKFYIVLAFIVLGVTLFGDVFSFQSLISSTFNIVSLFSFVVELTSVYALCDLIYSAIKVNKLSRLLSE